MKLFKIYPPSIPAWVSLPQRSYKEHMITQFSEGFPGIRFDENKMKMVYEEKKDYAASMNAFYDAYIKRNLDYFSISRDYASVLHLFIDLLAEKEKKLPVVKGHITGPLTLGLGITDEAGRALWFDQRYQDIIIKGLTMKALWQERLLRRCAEKIIIFCDEPILCALDSRIYPGITDDDVISSLNEIIGELKKNGITVGSHCCGNIDWGALSRTYLDIISFDAWTYGKKVARYAKDINLFLKQGGSLAWGLIPTLNPARLEMITIESIKAYFLELLDLFVKKGIKRDLLLERMIITPSCGMGRTLSHEESEHVLHLLSGLKDSLIFS